MNKILIVLILSSLGACALSPPQRPAVAVPDEVTSIDRALLTGGWSCREMNPLPGGLPITQELTFNADSTLRSVAFVPVSQQLPGASDMETVMTGNWSAEGDRIAVRNSTVDVQALDDSSASGPLAVMASSIAKLAPQGFQGSADVLRLTDEALILRGDDADAPTLSCSRA